MYSNGKSLKYSYISAQLSTWYVWCTEFKVGRILDKSELGRMKYATVIVNFYKLHFIHQFKTLLKATVE